MSFYLAIVSPLDSPLYELSFTSSRPAPPASNNTSTSSFPSWSTFTGSNGSDLGPGEGSKPIGGNLGLLSGGGAGVKGVGNGAGDRHLCQMVAHKSLDSVEEVMEGTGSLYLKNIDRYNEWSVSAFLAGSVKFILLHDTKNDDGIRLFFLDLWESYVKISLDPFHTVNTAIRNPSFESKTRLSARKYL